jgi:hypothetical protein
VQPRPRRTAALVLGLILVFQLALTLGSFHSRDDIVNDRPILNIDFCSQYYWAFAARAFHQADGRLWGYDPHFMAGYPLDFIFNSSLPIQLTAVALPGANLARIIKACFLASFILMPLLLCYSLSRLRLELRALLAATAVGACLFWLGENAAFGRFGMISGAFLLHFFLVPLCLLLHWLRENDRLSFVLFTLALALSLTIHKTAFVLTVAPALLLIALSARRLNPREWGLLGLAFLAAALLNLHWLWPFFRFLPLKVEDPATTFFQNTDLLRPLFDLFPFQAFFAIPLGRLLVVGAGVPGLLRLRRERPELFRPLAVLLGYFFVLSYFGSLLPPLRHLQPYRYVTAYFYLWLPATGLGLERLFERARQRGLGMVAAPVLGVALVALLFLPSFQAFSWVAPLRTDLNRDSAALFRWLEKNTDRSARILAEDINIWTDQPVFGGARLVGLIPALMPRELIGGPLPNAFIVHHQVSFEDGRLCGRPIGSMTDAEIDEVLRRYNVGWVVTWSQPSKDRLDRLAGLERAADFGLVRCWRAPAPPGFFLEGTGRSRADFNRIRLSGLATATGRVVVSYHWVEGLKSIPPAELRRVQVPGDPVGFIGILNPPAELELRLE